MGSNLLDLDQPFGVVHEDAMMGPGDNHYGAKNSISSNTTEVPNHHVNHSVSNADRRSGNPHANRDNAPFAWTGHPGK